MANPAIEKIGIMGGTFDPIHLGHLIIAELVREELHLNKVFFLPAKIHPLKENAAISAVEHRVQMVASAIEDNPAFELCDIEFRREGISFTVDTLRSLRKEYPPESTELYYLMGLDNVNQFHLWKEPEEIIRLCRVVVLGRPGVKPHPDARPFLPAFLFLDLPLIEISATDIRQRVRNGRTIRYLVPEAVEAYIARHRLYRG